MTAITPRTIPNRPDMMTREHRKTLSWLRYHYGNGDLSFQEFHNKLLGLYN